MEELLNLAREAIRAYLDGEEIKVSDKIKKKYAEKKASFVTLTLNGDLRGCIGTINAYQELWKDVLNNAIAAAFNDPRFLSLDKEELENIKIEVSVLSPVKKMEYENEKDLLEKIDKKMGIVLEYDGASATFLPQVWEQIPDKVVFLEELSKKAGLDPEAWKESKISYYRVEKVQEN